MWLFSSNRAPFPCILYLTNTSHFFTICQPQPSLGPAGALHPSHPAAGSIFLKPLSVFNLIYFWPLWCPVLVPPWLSTLSEVESLKQPPQQAIFIRYMCQNMINQNKRSMATAIPRDLGTRAFFLFLGYKNLQGICASKGK